MRGLAYRRHHRQRVRANARRVFKSWSRYGWKVDAWQRWLDESVAKLADNMAHCNRCCGNRRKWEPVTMQELRAPRAEEELPIDIFLDGDK